MNAAVFKRLLMKIASALYISEMLVPDIKFGCIGIELHGRSGTCSPSGVTEIAQLPL